MKRKVFIVLALLVIGGLLFTGCGRSGSSCNRIAFFYWDENQRPAMEDIVRMYTLDTGNPVDITIIPWAQYRIRLQTALQADTGPDVMWNNAGMTTDFHPLLHEISSLVARDGVDMSDFPSLIVRDYTHNGLLYAIPKDYTTIGLWYNKALFDAKGIPYPRLGYTWEELFRDARALTEGRIHGIVAMPVGQNFVNPWIYSNDGEIISADGTRNSWNHPNTIEALRYALMLHHEGLSPSSADQLELGGPERFNAGLAAMITDGSWRAPVNYEALGENLGVTNYPINRRPGNVISGLGFVMAGNTRNVEAAWSFLKTTATMEAQLAQAETVIPAFRGADAAWAANFPTLNLQVFIDAALYANSTNSPNRIAPGQQGVVTATYIEHMFGGGMDPAEAVAAIDREIDQIVRDFLASR